MNLNNLLDKIKSRPLVALSVGLVVVGIIIFIAVFVSKSTENTSQNVNKAVSSAVAAKKNAVAANKASINATATATNALLASAAANLTHQQAVDAAQRAKLDSTNASLLDAVKQFEDEAVIAQITAEKAAVAAESVYNQAVFATVASDEATRTALIAVMAKEESLAAQDRVDQAQGLLSKAASGSAEQQALQAELIAAKAAAVAAEKEREAALAAAAAAAIASQPITGIKYYIKTALNRPLKIRTVDGGNVPGAVQTLQRCDPEQDLGDCQWVFEKSTHNPGAYFIRSSDSPNLYLAATNGFALGSQQSLIACDPNNKNVPSCQWEFIPSATSEGMMYIKSAAGNLYLTTQSADRANPDLGDPMQLDQCDSSKNLSSCQWLLIPPIV